MTAQGSTATTPPAPNRRTYAILAVASAVFIAYGSLVPLTFRHRPLPDVVEAFTWAMTTRVKPQSRVDAVTNILIGIPLGFALLAMSRVDRDADWRRDILVGTAWMPACLALAAAVEFAQLYVPTRTCSGSDVICQGIGAAGGMAVWVVFGRRLNLRAREIWSQSSDAGTAGRLLLVYLLLLGFIQGLPLDLNPGPRELYRKVRDQTHLIPFSEFHGGEEQSWDAAAKFVKILGLFLPVGLLASRHRRIGASPLLMLAFAMLVATAAEAIQVAVHSRTPAATDVVAGMSGIAVGWSLGRRLRAGLGPETALILGQVWAAALLFAFWQPFHTRWPIAAFDWVPGMPMENPNPLLTLVELLEKPILFAPFGILVATGTFHLPTRGMLALATGIGVFVASVIEIGQLYVGYHYPGTTDILLGGFGAFAGAWIGSRVD